jgi:hypothetical protein
MPDLFKFVERHWIKTRAAKAKGLAEAERMLCAQMASDPTLAAARLVVNVKPRVRSVYTLYTRAKQVLETRMAGGPGPGGLDALPEGRVRGPSPLHALLWVMAWRDAFCCADVSWMCDPTGCTVFGKSHATLVPHQLGCF